MTKGLVNSIFVEGLNKRKRINIGTLSIGRIRLEKDSPFGLL